MIGFQLQGMARYYCIILQKTGNISIRSAAICMQPTCKTACELLASLHTDAESDSTSDSELINNYSYNKTYYKKSADKNSITDIDKYLTQSEEESRSLCGTLND